MDAFYERLIVRAATIDELLSDGFAPLPGQKADADLAAQRLAAWCRSCASGDWSLFARRLQRDGLSITHVLARFATVRHVAMRPSWIDDAMWVEAALQRPSQDAKSVAEPVRIEPCAFEQLFMSLVEQADAQLWSGVDAQALGNLSESARACLRFSLLKGLSDLCSPAIYERFTRTRKVAATLPQAAGPEQATVTSSYDQFVAAMRAGGFRSLFEDKPVLLRLVTSVTRQWIDAAREFIVRLDADLASIRRDLLNSSAAPVARIEADLSDPHNGGRSVKIVTFEDGSRVVYKPKDLRLDAAWYALIERLNGAAPIELKAVRALPGEGYGWTEFIDHAGCVDQDGCKRFFRRAGAWLALFHCFAATDMHQENIIAAGDHPVPIDLEMLLQAADEEHKAHEPEGRAYEAALEAIANSVMMVGLLPAYGRSPNNKIFAIGGMNADWNSRTAVMWNNINSDGMRPAKSEQVNKTNPNLPHLDGRYARLGDHVDDFVAGFEDYAKFLLHLTRDAEQGMPFDGFAGLPVRKIVRPTRFYYMLLQRLRNHRTMDDGVIWSAQADFLARLADWEKETAPLWPLQRAERAALVALNVPHFVSPSDGNEIRDAAGAAVRTAGTSGIDRARARVQNFDEQDLIWQIEVIRQNTRALARSAMPAAAVECRPLLRAEAEVMPTNDTFIAEADKIAAELSRHAIRRGPAAAWIGLDWLGDSEVFQLVPLGQELYNGLSGIALFLAAHAAVTGCKSSGELALAAVAFLRKNLKSRNAARLARALGIGGASGLGSVVYALAAMSKCLRNAELLADAHVGAELFSGDLIAADNKLDVIGGSAGAILSLLRLYRDTRSPDVLHRAMKCGEHLLAQPRVGAEGRRSWIGQGLGRQALNGMSHGAAGFAYALAALAAATGREEFARAAAECMAFEDFSYDDERHNWPDLRIDGELAWTCQWCHGATGIGLARIATAKRGGIDADLLARDIGNALAGVQRGWPGHVDTLCCGTLGSIEFFAEAAGALGRSDLRQLAARRLMAVLETAAAMGDYRWNTGKKQFNLGLFRGLAGVGYTLLRRVDDALPNVIIWD